MEDSDKWSTLANDGLGSTKGEHERAVEAKRVFSIPAYNRLPYQLGKAGLEADSQALILAFAKGLERQLRFPDCSPSSPEFEAEWDSFIQRCQEWRNRIGDNKSTNHQLEDASRHGITESKLNGKSSSSLKKKKGSTALEITVREDGLLTHKSVDFSALSKRALVEKLDTVTRVLLDENLNGRAKERVKTTSTQTDNDPAEIVIQRMRKAHEEQMHELIMEFRKKIDSIMQTQILELQEVHDSYAQKLQEVHDTYAKTLVKEKKESLVADQKVELLEAAQKEELVEADQKAKSPYQDWPERNQQDDSLEANQLKEFVCDAVLELEDYQNEQPLELKHLREFVYTAGLADNQNEQPLEANQLVQLVYEAWPETDQNEEPLVADSVGFVFDDKIALENFEGRVDNLYEAFKTAFHAKPQ